MISSFIKKFTEKTIPGIRKLGKQYYLAEDEIFDLKINQDAFSIGLFLGEDGKKFIPRPALLDLIAKHSDKKAYVDDKAEWLFLCGKDVFEKSIVKMVPDLKQGSLVLVQNQKDENLGLGIIERKGIKNLLDKGIYLREKQ